MKTNPKISFSKLFLVTVIPLIISSCATILGGKNNRLVFSEESLPRAEVIIDGEVVGEAPGTVIIPKGKIQHGSILVLNAEGYEQKEYVLLRKQSAAYSVIDLLIGGVPLVVDYTTGNIYRPKPTKFKYQLTKQN
ncbi:hypothetical protein [Maribellus mangrovi]|uniref:hypothetical protein n=1 Tax=Maribellus mangrovi TaxID=3133146 RepID=UPI0030EB43ED